MDTTIAAAFTEIALIVAFADAPDMLRLVAALREIGRLVHAYAYSIEDGCVENLDFETHSRGKNWMATVTPNRASPGGLDRTFWPRGSQRWYKMPSLPKPGDVIEMAGDYYSARGNKRTDRRYILVVRAEPEYLVGVCLGEAAPSTRSVAEARAKHLSVESPRRTDASAIDARVGRAVERVRANLLRRDAS